VILTSNVLIPRIGAVLVAEITGTEGPPSTHIEVPPEVGLTGRDQSWVNVTGLHTVMKGKLQRQRGRLGPIELDHVKNAIRLVLSLD
jgi:mRNA-degrading endonuclease toxin of MazEF toxin-antitoxin module